jgi:hypothetical protein
MKTVQICSNLFPRYRYVYLATLDGCKSLIYFTGLSSSHHFERAFGLPHFTLCHSHIYYV